MAASTPTEVTCAVMAHRWAMRGRQVFPCRDKRPLTSRGLLDATTDRATIERWWLRWPDANLAVRCGSPSGLVVLDVDGEAGADSLRDLERSYEPLPTTTSVLTPRGGSHYYFQHPGTDVKTTAGHVAAGLDIRGDGGYVLVPPSVGANGRAYTWDEEAQPAPMPRWLVAATTRQQARRAPEPVSTWLDIVRDGLPSGERNHGLVRFVGHLLARDVDARLVLELAQLVNGRNRPPLDASEVEQIVGSIAGCELRKRQRRTR